ncbi:MAG: hypothetical protein KKF85_10885 [Gammaproteobacteria bacterium]|nr:hypothetical protein [Rhodocyclaceae bacterium]MBU3909374.1 hypothetical protein [Gammaproteobacteria bacterium]MBU3990195.1 hypothetical protein [Gammaproteobacteria bacterium]MBU4005466.1 hypothetical protein [Gammaproteobacteria bacterium]MBU4020981.1 hypothetical protein [Gammaproteobacteria bacterium]
MKNEHWLDQPKNIKLLWRGFIAVLALTVLAEFVVHLHPHFEVEGLFGFHAAYGFVVCLLMIVFAKGLGLLLKRPDSYYADSEKDGGNE